MKLYKLDNVTRVHGTRTVLKIDALEIHPQKIYTLIGPNGAGKTSLLRILSFLDLPTAGAIEFMDKQVKLSDKHLYELRKKVVLLDQNPIMFTGSVWKNVEFGLKVRRLPVAERKNRISEALELVGMERFASYDAQALSGGETKRVALARALVLKPTVLLCDEPTANVDNENQEIILDIIEQTNKQTKTSVIFSTHYLSQGQRLADHTLLLQNGKLSDLVNENIFRITVVERLADGLVCKLGGQFPVRLPTDKISRGVNRGKIRIDPSQIVFNPSSAMKEGLSLSGHVVELSQQNGNIKLTVDAGVRLGVSLSKEQYDQERPVLGGKVELLIPYQSIDFSSLELL